MLILCCEYKRKGNCLVHLSGNVHKKGEGKERVVGGRGRVDACFILGSLSCNALLGFNTLCTLQPFLITVPMTTLFCPQNTKTLDFSYLISLLPFSEKMKSESSEWHPHLCSVRQRMGCHSQM